MVMEEVTYDSFNSLRPDQCGIFHADADNETRKKENSVSADILYK